MTFDTLGLSADLVRIVAEEGYDRAHARPGGGDPPRPRRTRRPRGSPDGHRQDRRVRPADPRSPAARTPTPASRRLDTRSASLILVPTRELAMQVDESVRHLWPDRSPAPGGRLRRDPDRAADQGAAWRDRDPRRHAGSAARPRRPADGQPRPGRDPRPRRSGPDARHGLPARYPADHRAAAGEAPEPACSRRRSRTTSGGCPATILRSIPVTVEVAARNIAAEDRYVRLVYPVDRDRKEALLAHLIAKEDLRQVLVFTRTKLGPTSRLATVPRPPGPRGRRDPLRPLAAGADARPRGVQDRRRSGSSWRPMSRRAASTSRTCRTS